MSKINERISAVIQASGLTKTAFAERLKVSQQHVSRLAKDGAPSDRTITDICREFGVSESWLRSGEGEMFLQLSRRGGDHEVLHVHHPRPGQRVPAAVCLRPRPARAAPVAAPLRHGRQAPRPARCAKKRRGITPRPQSKAPCPIPRTGCFVVFQIFLDICFAKLYAKDISL